MGYIPPVPFLSHYPFKCSASTEVRALFFRWGSRHKVCLEGGRGGGILSPHLWTRHQARKCSLQCTVLRLLIIQLQLATIMAKFIPTTCVTLILIAMFSTAHWRSSSGDGVALLSRTICTTVVVSDWCITNLAHGWWVSIQSIVGTVRGRNWSLRGPLRWKSVVMLGLIVGIHASGISIPLTLVMLADIWQRTCNRNETYRGTTIHQRSIWTTSSLSTTAWRTICFQIRYNTKIALSAT